MSEDKKIVNIGVVTFNRLEKTKLCLESIFSHDAGCAYLLTLVDNCSEDNTQEWLLQNSFPISNIILLNKNYGVAKASNVAWKNGPKDYYIKLDNDMVICKDGWLKELVNLCDTIPELGVCAFNVEAADYQAMEKYGLKFRIKNGNLGGCSMMIPKRTFDKLGYWCEDYGLYGEEDADYGYRVMRAGLWNVYHSDKSYTIHLPHPEYPESKPDDSWYAQFKKDKRKENLQPGSNYHKNINNYNRDPSTMRIKYADD